MKKSFLQLVTIALLFTGCGKNTRFSENMKDDSVIKASSTEISRSDYMAKHMTKELGENLHVDADIEFPDNCTGKIVDYMAEEYAFDKELVFEAFGIEKDHIKDLGYDVFQTSEKENIQISEDIGGSLSFSTEEGSWADEYSPDYADSYSDISNLGEGKVLNFMSPEDAEQSVFSLLQKLNIENAHVRHIYAIPIEYQIRIEQEGIEYGFAKKEDVKGDKWNNLGDIYEVKLAGSIKGIPLREIGYVASDDQAYNGSGIIAFVSKDGIVQIVIPNQYKIKKTISSPKRILTPDEIVNFLQRKMDSIIMTDSYTVTNIKLEYFPKIINRTHNEFQLIPIWEVEMVTNEDEEKNTVSYLFDARTGLELEL